MASGHIQTMVTHGATGRDQCALQRLTWKGPRRYAEPGTLGSRSRACSAKTAQRKCVEKQIWRRSLKPWIAGVFLGPGRRVDSPSTLSIKETWIYTGVYVWFVGVFAILGPHPQHMEVPGLGVELEL